MARVYASFRLYQLIEVGEPDDPRDLDEAQPGLRATADASAFLDCRPGHTLIKTGTDSGWIDVGLTIHGSRPEPLPGWEEVHEVEQVTISGELRVWSLEGVPVDPPLPSYCAEPESRLGIRLHVTGRAEGERAGVVPGTPVERHHIQLWPL